MNDRVDACRVGLAGLPIVRLGTFPTPLHRCDPLGRLLGVDRLWLKREDLTGYSWGGNKVRTIEFLLGDALAHRATDVVLAAAPSSNFAAVMAAAGAAHGLRVHQVAYGREPQRPPCALLTVRDAGAEVVFTEDSDRASMEVVAGEIARRLAREGRVPYVVPRGGASPVGAVGYVAGALELLEQIQTVMPSEQRVDVVLPLGSGGSTAGLLAGLAIAGVPWMVHAMSVSRAPEDIEEQLVNTAARCAHRCGFSLDAQSIIGRLTVYDARGRGFGVTSTADVGMATSAASASGLVIDPTYNAKALHVAARTAFGSGPLVYIATGGFLGAIDRATGMRTPIDALTV